ncbi:MAG: ATP-grasp domain-containing protein [Prevotellaceae bacterium]|jgi:hypothetical protein|nr:ATP-grasp domain-containing protein [Prevotellaceae bacterium]
MVILEEPYISEMLIAYLEENNIPVLENNFTKQFLPNNLNIKSAGDFTGQYHHSKKIYTTSEHALEWINSALNDNELNRQVALLKNKAAFREACKNLYPNFFYHKLKYNDLFGYDISNLSFPVVLKPTVGFLSAGVYTIFNAGDWKNALSNIQQHFKMQAATFPDVVVDDSSFIVESYITGKEFAIDLYFRNREPVIVNIFEHLFSSVNDVSDRLYITSKEIFDNYLMLLTEYISHLNKTLNLDRIPVHIELRVDGNNIAPIEINPLRFAGMCLNELNFYLTGKHPLEFYFSDTAPDYSTMWQGRENDTYCFSILEKQEFSHKNRFDMELITKIYSSILEIRLIENQDLNIQAFVFSKTDNKRELKNILTLKTY